MNNKNTITQSAIVRKPFAGDAAYTTSTELQQQVPVQGDTFKRQSAPQTDAVTRESELSRIWAAIRKNNPPSDAYIDALKEFLVQKNARAVLDAACGEGSHAILLAKLAKRLSLDLKVTCSDGSLPMIERCKRNSLKEDVEIQRFFHSNWLDLAKYAPQKFDAILLLGNSLGYAATWNNPVEFALDKGLQTIQDCLKQFYETLSENGVLLLGVTAGRDEQMRGRREQDEPIEATIDGQKIRVVDTHEWTQHTKRWTTQLWVNGELEPRFKATSSRPLLLQEELKKMVKQAGFRDFNEVQIGSTKSEHFACEKR